MNKFILSQEQYIELQKTLDEVKQSIAWMETLLMCATYQERESEEPKAELKTRTA